MGSEEESLSGLAAKFVSEFRQMTSYPAFYKEVQSAAVSPSVRMDSDWKRSLVSAMSSNGLETELRNAVFHWLRQNGSQLIGGDGGREPISYLRRAQSHWERRVAKSLQSLAREMDVPLARPRLVQHQGQMTQNWTQLSMMDVDLSCARPLYAPRDFLDVISAVRSPNYDYTRPGNLLGLIQVPLKVRSLSQMRNLLAELARGEAHLGVEPQMPAASRDITLEEERMRLGEKVVASRYAPVAQEFLKKGCPLSLRGKIWVQALGAILTPEAQNRFEELKKMVIKTDLITDRLILKDVEMTASNDDQYFVFGDILRQVLLCSSRDTEMLSLLRHGSHNPLRALLKSRSAPEVESAVIFPPSGLLPFHSLTMYASPLCYVISDAPSMHLCFKAMYERLWFRLHQVSSHPQGLLAICLLFERLLQRHEPCIWQHLRSLNIQPLRLSFPWLILGFSGYLPSEQLLLLWDLLLGYDSLEPLALLAVSIFSLRRDNLLQVHTQPGLEAVLADLSSIAVIPVLQLALMKDV